MILQEFVRSHEAMVVATPHRVQEHEQHSDGRVSREPSALEFGCVDWFMYSPEAEHASEKAAGSGASA